MLTPPKTARIRSTRDLAPDVRELTLDSPDEAVDFKPGQWLSFHLPLGEKPPLIRAYSLASPPAADGSLTLALDRVHGGLGSEYLFNVSPGEELAFTGPLGRFVLPDAPAPLLWLAHFTGIVPFRAMLLELAGSATTQPVTLLYSAHAAEALAYRDELAEIASRCPWFTAQFLTAPSVEAAIEATCAALPDLSGGPDSLTPMICGKREFVRPLRDHFVERGWDRRDVRCESYD